MGIREKYWVHCDWCDTGPQDPFDTYEEAYQEVQRLSRHESWLLLIRGKTVTTLLCPDCAAEGHG